MLHGSDISIRLGTGQAQRLSHLVALAGNYFRLDERTLLQQLHQVYGLSKQLHFYNADDHPQNNPGWPYFWHQDTSIRLALMAVNGFAGIDFEQNQIRFEQIDSFKHQFPVEAIQNLIKLDQAFLLEIEAAEATFPPGADRAQFRQDLVTHWKQPIEAFRQGLELARTFLLGEKQALTPHDDQIHIYELCLEQLQTTHTWLEEFVVKSQDWLDLQVPKEALVLNDSGRIITFFQVQYQRFFQNLLGISQAGLKAFAQNQNTGKHPPQTALLLGFLELWKNHLQADFNRFTQRHLDFYYQQVLRVKPKAAVPDRLFAYLSIAPDTPPIDLPVQTQLLAGKDSQGQDLVFESLEKSTHFDSQVQQLKTILISPWDDTRQSGHHGGKIFSAQVANSEGGIGEVPFTKVDQTWPPFGEDPDKPFRVEKYMREAEVGLLIGSPLLLLEEGKRKITLQLDFLSTHDRLSTLLPDAQLGQEFTGALPFKVYLSGPDAWLSVDPKLIQLTWNQPADNGDAAQAGIRRSMELSFTLPLDFAPIMPYQAELFPEQYPTHIPLLRLMLDQGSTDDDATAQTRLNFALLQSMQIQQVQIRVEVSAYRSLTVQNEFGLLDASQIFQPFGATPRQGQRFFLGSREVFSKPLTNLNLHLEWEGLPQDAQGFPAYYNGYDTSWINSQGGNQPPPLNPAYNNDIFRVKASILSQQEWIRIEHSPNGLPLFSGSQAPLAPKTKLSFTEFVKPKLSIDWEKLGTEPLILKPQSLHDFISLELQTGPDGFGHASYPKVLADTVMYNGHLANQEGKGPVTGFVSGQIAVDWEAVVTGKLKSDATFVTPDLQADPITGEITVSTDDQLAGTVELSGTTQPKPVQFNVFGTAQSQLNAIPLVPLPNAPYTPALKSISLDYSAEVRFGLSEKGDFLPQSPSDQATLLDTQLIHHQPFGHTLLGSNHLLPHFAFPGNLYLGLAPIGFGEVISILVVVDEGSNLIPESDAGIHWSYLSQSSWKPVPKEFIRKDTTQHFSATGIFQIQIPKDISETHSQMPSGLYWFRAAVQDPDAFSRISLVKTNALLAQRSPEAEAFQTPLPAGSVEKLSQKIPGISEIVQPLASFGGRAIETQAACYLRLAERIRHKQRAISPWDIERLVLEAFPDIFKATCLPARSAKVGEQPSLPGQYQLVVIPQYREAGAEHSLMPKASNKRLEEIRSYIASLSTPFAQIEVMNPNYEEIQVQVRLEMFPQALNGDNFQDLKRTLQSVLSPWVFSQKSEIEFGREIAVSAIIGELRRKTYVKNLIGFSYFHRIQNGDQSLQEIIVDLDHPYNMIAPKEAGGVLVSVPASQHEILEVHTTTNKAIFGIGSMMVEHTFFVSKDPQVPGTDSDQAGQSETPEDLTSGPHFWLLTP